MSLFFLYELALFIVPAMVDLSTNYFCFVFASRGRLVNLLLSAVVKYLDSLFDISAL